MRRDRTRADAPATRAFVFQSSDRSIVLRQGEVADAPEVMSGACERRTREARVATEPLHGQLQMACGPMVCAPSCVNGDAPRAQEQDVLAKTHPDPRRHALYFVFEYAGSSSIGILLEWVMCARVEHEWLDEYSIVQLYHVSFQRTLYV